LWGLRGIKLIFSTTGRGAAFIACTYPVGSFFIVHSTVVLNSIHFLMGDDSYAFKVGRPMRICMLGAVRRKVAEADVIRIVTGIGFEGRASPRS